MRVATLDSSLFPVSIWSGSLPRSPGQAVLILLLGAHGAGPETGISPLASQDTYPAVIIT